MIIRPLFSQQSDTLKQKMKEYAKRILKKNFSFEKLIKDEYKFEIFEKRIIKIS